MGQSATRRKFTKEFKQEAVRLSEQPDVFVTQVAGDLGVSVKQLYRWRAEFKEAPADAFRGNGRRRAAEQEVEQLRREVERLKMERDILKKATAFFASQSR